MISTSAGCFIRSERSFGFRISHAYRYPTVWTLFGFSWKFAITNHNLDFSVGHIYSDLRAQCIFTQDAVRYFRFVFFQVSKFQQIDLACLFHFVGPRHQVQKRENLHARIYSRITRTHNGDMTVIYYQDHHWFLCKDMHFPAYTQ